MASITNPAILSPQELTRQVPQLRTERPGVMPAVRFEAVEKDGGDQVDLGGVRRRYEQNRPTIDAMLDPRMSEEDRHAIQRDLGILPPGLLRAAQQKGYHIWVGSGEVPADLIKETGLTLKALPALNQMGKLLEKDPALKDAHEAYKRQPCPEKARVVQDRLAKEHGIEMTFPPSYTQSVEGKSEPGGTRSPEERLSLKELMSEVVRRASRGEPIPAELNALVQRRSHDGIGAPVREGQTMKDVARARGARTPEQVDEFVKLARASNPATFNPDRPLQKGQTMQVPDLFYYQDRKYNYISRRLIDGANNETTPGTTIQNINLIRLNPDCVKDPTSEGGFGHHRVVIHEFGHVAYDLVAADPKAGNALRTELQELHGEDQQKYGQRLDEVTQTVANDQMPRFGPWPSDPPQVVIERIARESSRIMKDDPKNPFQTLYSRSAPNEHYAESMEAFWTRTRTDGVTTPPGADGNYDELRARDPRMFRLLQKQMESFEAAGSGGNVNVVQ